MTTKKMTAPLLLLAACMALPQVAAAAGAGTTAAPFLKIGAGARIAGMANAYGAVADDSTAIFWNPAGLAAAEGKEFNFGYIKYFEDVKTGNVSYDMDTKFGKLGLGVIYLNVPDIERRGLTDSAGIVPSQGMFNAADLAISLGLAKKDAFGALPNVDVGAAVKMIRSTIDNKTATAFAADVGAIYRVHEKFRLGAALQNAGTQMKFVEEGDPLPISFRLGCA
ncbi:MAG TPA: PorV/PorQ family protein, partial [Elusimicrobiales bacterium]|nr:PorV/PorQ family protein [Elusimicrobiales bacterium]